MPVSRGAAAPRPVSDWLGGQGAVSRYRTGGRHGTDARSRQGLLTLSWAGYVTRSSPPIQSIQVLSFKGTARAALPPATPARQMGAKPLGAEGEGKGASTDFHVCFPGSCPCRLALTPHLCLLRQVGTELEAESP